MDQINNFHSFSFTLADLYETILRIPPHELGADHQAIVVPAYEVTYNSKKIRLVDKTQGINRSGGSGKCLELESCYQKHLFMIPHRKQELLSCLRHGPCVPFKEQQLTHVGIARCL